MSRLARKLVLSVLTVVLTVIALGTTTFAWFTLTNSTVIQPFDVTITESTGFQMAIGNPTIGEEDLLTWVNVLDAEDIADYIEFAYPSGLALNAVTTTDGVNFSTVDMNASTVTTAGFLELPINFRSDQALQIQWTNVTFPGSAFSWQADQPFVTAKGVSVNSGDTISIFPADSVRIAIVGNVPVVAYELPSSATNEVLGGLVAQDLSYLATPGDGLGAAGNINYYTFKNAGSQPVGTNAVTVLETITAIASNPVHNLEASLTAGAAYYGKVVIRIWIEGWDANMYDSVLSAVISVGFSFAGFEV